MWSPDQADAAWLLGRARQSSTVPVEVREVELRGELARFRARADRTRNRTLAAAGESDPMPRSMLFDGPAGTGKTQGILHTLNYIQETYPGTRGLILRTVRSDLAGSVLTTLERLVWGGSHPAMGGLTCETRLRPYQYPNGSVIRIGGLNRPTSTYSSEYHWIYWAEVTDCPTEDKYQQLLRMLRFRAADAPDAWPGVRFLVMCCNPAEPTHWSLAACEAGRVSRCQTTHHDNPRFVDRAGRLTHDGREYIRGTLGSMVGFRRRRLLHGEWCAAEHLIFSEFDPTQHVIDPGPVAPGHPFGRRVPPITRAAIGMDFGDASPGAAVLVGLDAKRRAWVLRERMAAGKGLQWWAEVIAAWATITPIDAVWCDSAHAGEIRELNLHLARLRARAGAKPVRKERVALGWARISRLLRGWPRLGPALLLAADSCEDPDPELRAAYRPVDLRGEIAQYQRATDRDGRPIDDQPRRGCSDHACDALRYATAAWSRHGMLGLARESATADD